MVKQNVIQRSEDSDASEEQIHHEACQPKGCFTRKPYSKYFEGLQSNGITRTLFLYSWNLPRYKSHLITNDFVRSMCQDDDFLLLRETAKEEGANGSCCSLQDAAAMRACALDDHF